MEETDHATRMSTLRRELEQERNERSSLLERITQLEAQLEALRTTPSEDEEEGEDEQPLAQDENAREEAPSPQPAALSEEKGLPHLTSLYGTALQDSKNIQKVSLERPAKFTGAELEDNPYALTYWFRDVLCWCQAYAYDRPKEQLVLAINQALAGTAKSMVQNLIMGDPGALTSVEDLYAYLKRTFQSQDPGPEAWREFHTTRMRRSENALHFLNRLVQLSFVVNASNSPVCRTLTEQDISARLQHGLPAHLQRALYKHLNHLIEVDKTPDMQPGNLAAIIFKIERETTDQSRKENGVSERYKNHPPPDRAPYESRARPTKYVTSVMTAMPQSAKGNSPTGGTLQRQRKRFDDLSDEQKSSIIRVQTQLATNPLGTKLSLEERNLCMSHGLCQRCRRYGHDHPNCRMASIMGAPKN